MTRLWVTSVTKLRSLLIIDPRVLQVFMTLIFALLGLALLVQPGRFYNTPSYGTLLQILPIAVWGGVYLVCALLGAATLYTHGSRPMAHTSHTVSLLVTLSWWVAFAIRWATDDGTTIVNVLTWGTFLFLIMLIRAWTKLDDKT
jgi:hypothetical protein